MATLLEQVDASLDELIRSWNVWSTLLFVLLLVLLVYPLLTSVEPDTHPLLLTRQANISLVRQPGESATYRSLEVPHGYPLRSGLNVKEPGQSKWAPGTDGDLRDVWYRVVKGSLNDEGQPTGQTGKILTIYGKASVTDHDFGAVNKDINAFGQAIKAKGLSSVAVYLPNCLELLEIVFAGAFYGFQPVLIPYDQQQDIALQLIALSSAEYLVAPAGSLPLAEIRQKCPDIKEIAVVVEPSSRELDFADDGAVAFHELVEASNASCDLPPKSANTTPPDLVTIWQNDTPTSGELVAFTQKNLVSAIGAQISALPAKHRINASDLFLPADTLTGSYVLALTLAALFSNASIVLNSVAGRQVEIALAARGVAPTIIAASAESALKLHKATKGSVTTLGKKLALSSQASALAAGRMPPASKLASPATANTGSAPGKLRLLYVYERAHAGSPPLSSHDLVELRAFTGARVVYGLTAAKVAGAVAQTGVYDYRVDESTKGRHSHFGVPLASVEIKTVDTDSHKTTDDKPQGELVVSGPSVKDGSAKLGVKGTFRSDGTLAYV